MSPGTRLTRRRVFQMSTAIAAARGPVHPATRRGKVRAMSASVIGVAMVLAVAGSAAAQAPDFYKGRSVTINVAGGAGGGIDIGARALAPFIGKHLRGEPQVIVQIMPGAGGVRVLDHLARSAPKDGTVIGAFAPGPLLEPIIGSRNPPYGIADFPAIGALEKDNTFCTTWATSPVKTLDDARKSQVTVAGTGSGAGTDTEPVVLNEVLGTKFKVITGYPGTQETALAVERGEVDGRCGFGFASIKASRPQWLQQNKLNFLIQLGLEPSPLAPHVPLALDLADTPDKKEMIRVMSAPAALGRPYLGAIGMQPERLAELRQAFSAALADPGFIADFAKTSGGDRPSPTNGETMQAMLSQVQGAPRPVIERLRKLFNP